MTLVPNHTLSSVGHLYRGEEYCFVFSQVDNLKHFISLDLLSSGRNMATPGSNYISYLVYYMLGA